MRMSALALACELLLTTHTHASPSPSNMNAPNPLHIEYTPSLKNAVSDDFPVSPSDPSTPHHTLFFSYTSLPMPGTIPQGYCDGLWNSKVENTKEDRRAHMTENRDKPLEYRSEEAGGYIHEQCTKHSRWVVEGGVKMQSYRDVSENRAGVWKIEKNNEKRGVYCSKPSVSGWVELCALMQINPEGKKSYVPRVYDAWRCGKPRDPVMCFEMELVIGMDTALYSMDSDIDPERRAIRILPGAVQGLINAMAKGVVGHMHLGGVGDNESIGGDAIALMDWQTADMCRTSVPDFLRPTLLIRQLEHIRAISQAYKQDKLTKHANNMELQFRTGKYDGSKLPTISQTTYTDLSDVTASLQASIDARDVDVGGFMPTAAADFNLLQGLVRTIANHGRYVYLSDTIEVAYTYSEGNVNSYKLKSWTLTGFSNQWATGQADAGEILNQIEANDCGKKVYEWHRAFAGEVFVLDRYPHDNSRGHTPFLVKKGDVKHEEKQNDDGSVFVTVTYKRSFNKDNFTV